MPNAWRIRQNSQSALSRGVTPENGLGSPWRDMAGREDQGVLLSFPAAC